MEAGAGPVTRVPLHTKELGNSVAGSLRYGADKVESQQRDHQTGSLQESMDAKPVVKVNLDRLHWALERHLCGEWETRTSTMQSGND